MQILLSTNIDTKAPLANYHSIEGEIGRLASLFDFTDFVDLGTRVREYESI